MNVGVFPAAERPYKGIRTSGSLRYPTCDKESSANDEHASNINGQCGGLVEPYPGQDLGHHEEEHDINAEQPAEIPARRIDGEAIERKDDYAKYEEECAHGTGSTIESRLKEGIPERLQKCRKR